MATRHLTTVQEVTVTATCIAETATATAVPLDWKPLSIMPRTLRTLHLTAVKYPQVIMGIMLVKMDISTKTAITGLCSSNQKT